MTTSSDEETWTRQLTGLDQGTFYDLIYAGGQFLAVSDFALATSADGLTWQRRGSSGGQAAAYGAGLYVVVGGKIQTSPDGLTWTTVKSGNYTDVTLLNCIFRPSFPTSQA